MADLAVVVIFVKVYLVAEGDGIRVSKAKLDILCFFRKGQHRGEESKKDGNCGDTQRHDVLLLNEMIRVTIHITNSQVKLKRSQKFRFFLKLQVVKKLKGAVMKVFLVVLSVCMATGSALAAVYEWVDDKGVINFTDNAEKIPAKYRNKAREKDLSQEKNIFVIKGGSTPAAPSGTGTGGSSGGHDQNWWRARISSLRDQTSQSEEQLEAKRRQLVELRHRRVVYQKGSDRISYNRLKAEIERDEASLKELRSRLSAAEAEAAAAGITVQ